MFRKDMYVFKGGASAAAMKKDVKVMAKFALKLLKGEKITSRSRGRLFWKRGQGPDLAGPSGNGG